MPCSSSSDNPCSDYLIVKVKMKCFFLLNLKEQQKSGRSFCATADAKHLVVKVTHSVPGPFY